MFGRFLTALTIAAIASVLYATSAPGAQRAAPPSGAQFTALEKQVRTLRTHLQALQERTTILRSQVVYTLKMLETAMRDGETCFAAVTADEFQNTWSQIDRLAVGLEAKPIFGTQAAVDDYSACRGLGVARASLDPSAAPTVSPVKAFIAWLNGG